MTTTYNADLAAREYTAALDALRLAEDFSAVMEGLAAAIYGDWEPAARMTCFEADALALALLAGGQRSAAERVIYVHSTNDLLGYRHACHEGERWNAARDHADRLIAGHAAHAPVFARDADDPPPSDLPLWTVEVAGGERHYGESGYLYGLCAPDADTAAAYAMSFHLHAQEEPDLNPDTPDHNGEPMYVVVKVTPGFVKSGHVNDLRAARFTAASVRRTNA